MKVMAKCSRLKLGRFRKMSCGFCGPFQILKIVDRVAYALDLPKH